MITQPCKHCGIVAHGYPTINGLCHRCTSVELSALKENYQKLYNMWQYVNPIDRFAAEKMAFVHGTREETK